MARAAATRSVKTFPFDEQDAFYNALTEWHKVNEQAAVLKAKEAELRRAICDKYFPNPVEGTNTLNLDFGKALKATFPITRSVDETQLDALKTLAKTEGRTSVLSLCDLLFSYKPSLATGEWKSLTADERKIFADVITEKPGMPGIKIETPKT